MLRKAKTKRERKRNKEKRKSVMLGREKGCVVHLIIDGP